MIKFTQHRVPFGASVSHHGVILTFQLIQQVKWLLTMMIVGFAGLNEFSECSKSSPRIDVAC
jgi:hypothetical protein